MKKTRRSFFKQCAAAVAVCYGVRFNPPAVGPEPDLTPIAWQNDDGSLGVRADLWANMMGTDRPNTRAILTDIQP